MAKSAIRAEGAADETAATETASEPTEARAQGEETATRASATAEPETQHTAIKPREQAAALLSEAEAIEATIHGGAGRPKNDEKERRTRIKRSILVRKNA